MNPEYPIFIPSKNRWKTPLTIRAFQKIKVPFTVVVEAQEVEHYKPIVGKENLLVLPHRDKGLTVTRNWIWDYAQHELKTPYFWTFDDNISGFYRLHKNLKYNLACGTFLKVIEDFAQRYVNLFITGMNYEGFCYRRRKWPPLVINTRVYSNMLIKTDIPYRNRLFYNDDTDLCLQILKDGHCTCQVGVFLIKKIATMKIKGGMTDFYEKTNNRLEFAKELQKAHPDVVTIVKRYGRWHHQVNYAPFRHNKLIKKPNLRISKQPDNYGMVFKYKK